MKGLLASLTATGCIEKQKPLEVRTTWHSSGMHAYFREQSLGRNQYPDYPQPVYCWLLALYHIFVCIADIVQVIIFLCFFYLGT